VTYANSVEMTVEQQVATLARVVFEPEDHVEVTFLAGSGIPKGTPGRHRFVRAHELSGIVPDLQRESDDGWNVYYGVCPRTSEGGTKKEDVIQGHVLWADFDDTSLEDALAKAIAAKMPIPTLVVWSGHGVHIYWRMSEPVPAATLEPVIGRLAEFLDSDPAVKNRNRLMRLPGFPNLKREPTPCYVVQSNPAFTYHPGLLLPRLLPPTPPAAAAYPPATAHPAAPAPRYARTVGANRPRAYIDKIPRSGKPGRNVQAFKVACVLVNDFQLDNDAAFALLVEWDAGNTPPLITEGEHELRKLIENAKKYAQKPSGGLSSQPPQGGLSPQPPSTPAAGNVNWSSGAPATIPLPGAPAAYDDLAKKIGAECAGHDPDIHLPYPRVDALVHPGREGTVCVLCGGPGIGKSLWCAESMIKFEGNGVAWAYLPLEDDTAHFLRRCTAILEDDFEVLDDASVARKALVTHEQFLRRMQQRVVDQPRRPEVDEDGLIHATRINADLIRKWASQVGQKNRVLIIDSLAMIAHDDRDQWRSENELMADLVAIAQKTGSTIMLVAHTVKQPGSRSQLGLADVQGAAGLTRAAHSVLLMGAHETKESMIYQDASRTYRSPHRHNRTMWLAKSRNGAGQGLRIAFQFGEKGSPRFKELGIIAPKPKPTPAAAVGHLPVLTPATVTTPSLGSPKKK